MKRRNFIYSGAGALLAGLGGCSQAGKGPLLLKSDYTYFDMRVTKTRPKPGTIPTGEIGRTGIKVTTYGYGSHIHKDMVPLEKERCTMIREAYELGVRLFDVYETNGASYQYEPMGRHLAPFINDVVISIFMEPSGGRNVEREVERALRLFGRDHIDMVRNHAQTPKDAAWAYWESLFKLKEKGYIRAVGMPIHYTKELDVVLKEKVPLDYVVVPYNFYHNLLWTGVFTDDFMPLGSQLREKGIGIVTMKPFGSDWFVNPLIKAAKHLDETGEISLPRAALKWIVNSDLKPDTTLGGMYSLDHVYEDVPAYYDSKMTPEETKLLAKLCKVAKVQQSSWLPDHYRFLDKWVPDSPDSVKENGIV